MATRNELIALAERCEAAIGTDRELDKAIYAMLGNCNHDHTKYYCIEDGNDTDSGFTCLDCGTDTYGAKSAPAYTASLDAAMTLVPEGWRIRSLDASIVNRFSWLLIGPMEYDGDEPTGPALAGSVAAGIARSFCAAALRARAAIGPA